MGEPEFAELVEGFFLQWMTRGRRLSPHTVSSYRDTFTLLLCWMRDANGIPSDEMVMNNFTADAVEGFLLHLSEFRGNSATTVNCRLAALKAFGGYVTYRAPERLDQMKRVKDIPRRVEKRREVAYITKEEYGWILEACAENRVNRLMVQLLFSAGVRISELVGLKVGDFAFGERGASMSVLGKGRKSRVLPLWPEVAEAVREHSAERGLQKSDYLFAGRNVAHLTRSGARSRLESVVAAAAIIHPSLAKKKVTPHVFRHSTAMGMLEAGVDISTIAIWLGHENIQTTHRYMITDMKRKEEALRKVHSVRDCSAGVSGRYTPGPGILEFLQSL